MGKERRWQAYQAVREQETPIVGHYPKAQFVTIVTFWAFTLPNQPRTPSFKILESETSPEWTVVLNVDRRNGANGDVGELVGGPEEINDRCTFVRVHPHAPLEWKEPEAPEHLAEGIALAALLLRNIEDEDAPATIPAMRAIRCAPLHKTPREQCTASFCQLDHPCPPLFLIRLDADERTPFGALNRSWDAGEISGTPLPAQEASHTWDDVIHSDQSAAPNEFNDGGDDLSERPQHIALTRCEERTGGNRHNVNACAKSRWDDVV